MQHRQYPPRFRNGRGVGKKRTFGATLVSSNVKKSKFGKKRQYAAKGWKKSGRNRRIIRKKRLRGARYARICFFERPVRRNSSRNFYCGGDRAFGGRLPDRVSGGAGNGVCGARPVYGRAVLSARAYFLPFFRRGHDGVWTAAACNRFLFLSVASGVFEDQRDEARASGKGGRAKADRRCLRFPTRKIPLCATV